MLRHPCSPPGRLLPLYQLIHNHPVSLLLQSVSPLSFLFLLTFLYLPDPSSPPWLPLPSFRGPLIHLLSTQSLINRPTFCLSLCYRHSLSIHLLYALVFHFKLTFFFCLSCLQTDKLPPHCWGSIIFTQTICLSESQQDTEIHFLCERLSSSILIFPSWFHCSSVFC